MIWMDFSEQCHIEDVAWDVRCDEKSVSSKIYQQYYVYGGCKVDVSITSR